MFGPRPTVDYTKFTTGMKHEQYARFAKDNGFDDICECDLEWGMFHTRTRPGSGRPGMLECTECHYLLMPFLYVYECDECMEPTIPDTFTIRQDEKFLCEDCL